MPSHSTPASLTLLAASFWLLTTLASAKDNALPDRDTPVPPDQPIPSVDFMRPRLLEQPVLNPAGTYFAALTYNEKLLRAVVVCEIATGKYEWTNGNVLRFDWISDRHLLLNHVGDALPLEGWRVPHDEVAVVVEVGKLRKVIDGLKLLPARERGFQPATGFQWGWRPDLPRNHDVEVERFWTQPADGKTGYCQLIGKDGRRQLLRYVDNKWQPSPVDLNEITPVAIGDQPDEMIVVGPRAPGQPRALQRMNVATGALGEVLYRDRTYDCQPRVHYRRGTRQVIGVAVANIHARPVWLDLTLRDLEAFLNKQFPSAVARIISMDLKQARFLVEVESDRQPPTYYFYDREKRALGLIKSTAPWIDPARMLPTQVISYRARDGVAIEGLLTLPAGASKAKPVPVVVVIHGGPWEVRSDWGWDDEAQFLANRGYAVFKPNYRGSLGYDSRVEPRDRFDFAKMHRDVADGVSAMGQSGLFAMDRIAVLGMGHGSYLALCGVLEQPALYRCAILYGGIFDWERAFKKTDSRAIPQNEWLRQQLALHQAEPVAPLCRADEIAIPVFFNRALSVLDITRETQAPEMFRALKAKPGVVGFGDLNMYTSNEVYAQVWERADRIEEFLRQHLAGK